MGNIATRIEDQIKQLSQRGMDLDLPEEKVKEILLDIGYYRLGFYWHPFEIDRNHNLKEGTRFSDIVELYYLDFDLRSILMKYMNRVEINFRTKLVYYVSNKYRDSPTWFVNPKVMEKGFIDDFDHFYTKDFIANHKSIQRHHKKYINDKYAPAWKTIEFFTFGSVLKIYRSLKDESIKERISNIYGIKNTAKFSSTLEKIVYLRNTCAHGRVLFDFNLPTSLSTIPGIDYNGDDRHSLDACVKTLLYLLNNISSNRKSDLENVVKDLHENISKNQVIKGIIKTKSKFSYK